MSQSYKKPDLRVERTRKYIREAFFELIRQKGFEAISIKDITEHAMINRTTFYRHFLDKHDLARKCMDDEFLSLIDQISRVEQDNNGTDIPPSRNFKILLNHLGEKADLYSLLFGQGSNPVFISRLKEYIIQILRFRIKDFSFPQSSLPQDMFEEYLAGAYIGVIQWYFSHSKEYKTEKIAEWLYTLVAEGSKRALNLGMIKYE